MNKLFMLLLAAMITTGACAQVLINLQLPPSGVVVKNQLWNLSLVNTSNSTISIQIELTLTDVSNNQRVFTGTSKVLQLPKGIRQIQSADVMPVVYNIISNSYGVDANPDGFLPIGIFDACFNILRVTENITEQLTEDCETIDIEPISPPMLITPSDSDHVNITHPFFAWLPPTPFYLFNNLMYDWVLVEVQGEQTGATAIQQNIPVLSQSNIPVTNFQYPLSQAGLDTGKIYAWQVTAKNSISAIAKSEVWTFTVQQLGFDSSITPVNQRGFYAKLSPEENGSFVACYGSLQYEYVNIMNNSSIELHLSDITATVRRTVTLDSLSYNVKTGQNLMKLDLSNYGLKDRHTYLLDITDKQQQHYYLKFEFRKPD